MSDGLQLISAALSADSIRALYDITPDMLLDNEVTAFDYVMQHYRRYRTLPTQHTVREETGITLTLPRESVDYYLDRVGDRYVYNRIREQLDPLRESLRDRNMEEARARVQDMARIRLPNQHGESVVTYGEALAQVTTRLDRVRNQAGMSGILTGWDTFDQITAGYQNADLITWVARPSVGKTYLLLYQAIQARNAGHSVMVVTTEMGTEAITRRAMAIDMSINPNVLKTGMVSSYLRRRIGTYIESMVSCDRLRIFSVGIKGTTGSIDALIDEYRPSIVFIDGVYLLNPASGKNLKRLDKVPEVFDDLKRTTIDGDLPIVVTSQFSRQAGKQGKDGSLETIGYSDVIGQHSSIVVGVKMGPSENPRGMRELDFMKGREGETGTVYTNFKFAPTDFSECSVEQAEQAGAAQDVNLDWMR